MSSNTNNYPLEHIIQKKPSRLSAAILSGDYAEQKDNVSIATLSDVKGFEFSLIIIVGCSDAILPDPRIPEDEKWRDALRLYVAMTRGRDQVVLSYENKPSKFLESMKEYLRWEETTVDEVISENTEKPADSVKKIPINKNIKFSPKPQKLELSSSAEVFLRSYFRRHELRNNKGVKDNPRRFNTEFKKWLMGNNLNGISTSILLEMDPLRTDITMEIDEALKKQGFGLKWDS